MKFVNYYKNPSPAIGNYNFIYFYFIVGLRSISDTFTRFCIFRSIRYYMDFNIHFTRTTEDGIQETDGRFRTPMQTIGDVDFIDVDELTSSIDKAIDQFNARGSGWILDYVISARVVTCVYRPTQGSTYFETPKGLKQKRAVINIRNTDDQLCFVWSVLQAIHPDRHHNYLPSSYRRFLGELDLTGLSFPLKVADVAKFEKLNPNISVNVNSYEHEPVPEVHPLYISPDRQRQHHVNLLLLTDDASDRQHYVLISSLSRLLRGRTNHTGDTTSVCPYCLYCFREPHSLESHIPECKTHSPQRISYPPPGEKVKFKNVIRTHKVPFTLYCDFESFLQPVIDDEHVVSEHVPSGFCCLRVSQYPEYETPLLSIAGRESCRNSLSI